MSDDDLIHPKKPCAECPWRTDVEPGRFEPGRFAVLAGTAYDMSNRIFQCHKTRDEAPVVCAGFLLRGAEHNLAIRLALHFGRLDLAGLGDGGYPLFDNYRAMAVANGVAPDDPTLVKCRD